MEQLVSPTYEQLFPEDYQIIEATPELEALTEADKRARDRKGRPEDIEETHRQTELSAEAVKKYRIANQDEFTDEKARAGNILSTKEFLRRLQTISGVHTFLNDVGIPGQIGLFVTVRGQESRSFRYDLPKGIRYVCAMQVPYMQEWTVLTEDEHTLVNGYKYIGWRQVLWSLIRDRVISEAEAHELFGAPQSGPVSRQYREHLYNFRNHKKEE